jgi:hypothetical protein
MIRIISSDNDICAEKIAVSPTERNEETDPMELEALEEEYLKDRAVYEGLSGTAKLKRKRKRKEIRRRESRQIILPAFHK